jgi:hypothetical protein
LRIGNLLVWKLLYNTHCVQTLVWSNLTVVKDNMGRPTKQKLNTKLIYHVKSIQYQAEQCTVVDWSMLLQKHGTLSTPLTIDFKTPSWFNIMLVALMSDASVSRSQIGISSYFISHCNYLCCLWGCQQNKWEPSGIREQQIMIYGYDMKNFPFPRVAKKSSHVLYLNEICYRLKHLWSSTWYWSLQNCNPKHKI